MATLSVARTRRSPQPGKLAVYQQQASINLALENVVFGCQQLQPVNIIPRRLLILYANMAEELRALINSAIVEEMRSVESKDAKHFQDLRLKWESRPGLRIPKEIKTRIRAQAKKPR